MVFFEPHTPLMKLSSLTSLLVLALPLASGPVHAASANWDGDTNPSWNNDGNWSAANPNGTTQVATFNQATYLNQPNLNVNRSISSLVFGASNGGITLTANAGLGLTLNAAVGILMNAGSGATTVAAPVTLAIPQTWRNQSANLLTISGTVNNNGNLLVVDNTTSNNSMLLSGAIIGGGGLTLVNGGFTTLTGAVSYAGTTNINAGTLLVNSTYSGAGGVFNVNSGGGVGGTGSINRAATVADNGILTPGDMISGVSQSGELSFSNGLTLNNSSSILFDLAAPASLLDDEISLTGNFTLDGVLTVNQLGGFGSGTYTLFTYSGGTFTDNGLTVTALGGGLTGTIDTTLAGEVRLIVVPEPSAAVAFLCGGVFLLIFRREGRMVRA